jgi:hypothetical protein
MQSDSQTFPSKIDTWLALVVGFGVAMAWFSSVGRIWVGRPVDALDFIIPALVTVFTLWVFRGTYYVVTADELIARAGPIRRTVPLQSIERLRATRNPLSSPALSLDRIEIAYGSKRLLVSPEDRRGFVRAVTQRVPAVVLEGLSAT